MLPLFRLRPFRHFTKYIQFRRGARRDRYTVYSPLFRDKFDPSSRVSMGTANKDCLKEMLFQRLLLAVRLYYNRLLFSIGLRSEKKRRHDFSVFMASGKWYKTRCEIGGMKPVNVETLLNHSIGISDSYYRPRES